MKFKAKPIQTNNNENIRKKNKKNLKTSKILKKLLNRLSFK